MRTWWDARLGFRVWYHCQNEVELCVLNIFPYPCKTYIHCPNKNDSLADVIVEGTLHSSVPSTITSASETWQLIIVDSLPISPMLSSCTVLSIHYLSKLPQMHMPDKNQFGWPWRVGSHAHLKTLTVTDWTDGFFYYTRFPTVQQLHWRCSAED